MGVSHLDFFYETRGSVYVDDSDPCNSPNTELRSVPEAATIEYEGFPDRSIDSMEFEAPDGKGYQTAKMLIERAMLDPDARVIPE